MAMGEKHFRTLTQIHEDNLWPDPWELNPQKSRRHQAIAEVLCCIPESGYRRLKQLKEVGILRWFVPGYEIQGAVACFDNEGGIPFKLVYLSPCLESRAWRIVVAAVARELAHLVLDHPLGSTGRE